MLTLRSPWSMLKTNLVIGMAASPPRKARDMAIHGHDFLDEEGLTFDEHQDAFVLLDGPQIVWTVRGIRFFSPRFRHVGVAIAQVKTPAQFRAALRKWDEAEWKLLCDRIESRAESSAGGAEHRCLWAILSGDPRADAMIAGLLPPIN